MTSIDHRLSAAGLPSLPRGIWLEIDVDALANNLAVFRELVGPGVQINAVVKADAYGHGLKSVGLAFASAGAERLCVASLDEAFALRDAGVTIPILVLYGVPLADIDDVAAAGMEITVSDSVTCAALLERQLHVPGALALHFEVETGLTRGGLVPEAIPGALHDLAQNKSLRSAGLWTHLAAPEDEAATDAQIAEFERAESLVRGARLPLPPRHVAATGGLLAGRAPNYEGVRLGLGLYGLVPLDLPMPPREQAFAERLRPAMALKCRALRIERFPVGVAVSYGGRWRTERDSIIATLPVGYADAIPRPAPWGNALVRGQRVPLVGTVAMDAVMADVTEISELKIDDEFVLLGHQDDLEISTATLARARNTIPWEVVTSMSYRIPRVYHAGSVPVGMRTLNADIHNSSNRLSNEGVHGVTYDAGHLPTSVADDPAVIDR